MIANRLGNMAKDIVGDVGGEVISNISSGQPVTPGGVRQAAQRSAQTRMQEQSPIPIEPIQRTIEGIANRTKTNTTNTGKGRKGSGGKKSGGGKGKGKGGRNNGGGRSAPGTQQSPTNLQNNSSAYGNITAGQLYTISSEKDTTYWTDILQDQLANEYTKNTSRTALTVINTDTDCLFEAGNSSKLVTAYQSIYMQKLNEAIGETGGNASIKNSFTYGFFWKSQRYALSAMLILAEIYSIRAWDPPYDETNTVIRQLKNACCSSTNLMDATTALEEAVAQYALPPEAIKTAIAIFQTYKKSPVSGGVHTRFISHQLLSDIMSGTDFTTTITKIENLTNNMIATSWTQDNSTITSLLLNKCNGFVSCRCNKVGAQYPTYQMDFNAMFDNLKYAWEYTNSIYTSSTDQTSDKLQVAYPFDVNNIPKHVTSSLLLRFDEDEFGSKETGYPWFAAYMEGKASRYIGINNNSGNYNVSMYAIESEFNDITDNSFSIAANFTSGYFKPIGLNTQVFQPTYEVVVNATRDILYNVYSMPSMS